MSEDLPTRDEFKNGIWTTAYLTTTGAPIVRAYADGDLLTRVEAANDPEVQKAVGWKLGYYDGKDWM